MIQSRIFHARLMLKKYIINIDDVVNDNQYFNFRFTKPEHYNCVLTSTEKIKKNEI